MAQQIKIGYLPTNQSWCLLFGTEPLSLYDKVGFVGRLFDTKEALIVALQQCNYTSNQIDSFRK
jgi:hypothetical protein